MVKSARIWHVCLLLIVHLAFAACWRSWNEPFPLLPGLFVGQLLALSLVAALAPLPLWLRLASACIGARCLELIAPFPFPAMICAAMTTSVFAVFRMAGFAFTSLGPESDGILAWRFTLRDWFLTTAVVAYWLHSAWQQQDQTQLITSRLALQFALLYAMLVVPPWIAAVMTGFEVYSWRWPAAIVASTAAGIFCIGLIESWWNGGYREPWFIAGWERGWIWFCNDMWRLHIHALFPLIASLLLFRGLGWRLHWPEWAVGEAWLRWATGRSGDSIYRRVQRRLGDA